MYYSVNTHSTSPRAGARRVGAMILALEGAVPRMRIEPADPTDPSSSRLLDRLSDALEAITWDSGRASFDPLDVQGDGASFVLAYDDEGRPLGCGAYRPLAEGVAELKRMFALPGTKGVGAAILACLETARGRTDMASFGWRRDGSMKGPCDSTRRTAIGASPISGNMPGGPRPCALPRSCRSRSRRAGDGGSPTDRTISYCKYDLSWRFGFSYLQKDHDDRLGRTEARREPRQARH